MRLVSAQSPVDAAFRQFWDARNPQEAAAAGSAVVKSGARFADALARLKKGRPYAADVPRGVVRLSHAIAAVEFPYTLDVPQTYDPARKYQIRVQLHGGVGRPDPATRGDGSIGSLAGAEQIYVLPTSWADAPWWDESQLESLRVILDRVKRMYNVDENRVVMSGVSDGGTGSFYFAMRDTTPFAAFLPLNGFIMILANPSLGLSEELFPHNLLNKPFFVVNGGRDPLYPAAAVEPYVRHLQKGGMTLDYDPQPDGVHNTAWWPAVKETFETFARNHPRDPFPSRLTWEVEQAPEPGRSGEPRHSFNRAHWLVVDKVGKVGSTSASPPLPDLNELSAGSEPNFGVRTSGMRITSVQAGSNAEQIGLKSGDLVVSINGRSLPAALDLLEILAVSQPGERLTFMVSRDSKPVEASGVFSPAMMPRLVPLFPRGAPSGRVDLVREGNTVRATTRGVAGFTLLASPDAFNFAQPITVVADGRTVFNGRVETSVATLMKWAALDNDRTMLFGAEIRVSLEQ
jgi:pimeloyl-ACP methyl ester carboxylesterase